MHAALRHLPAVVVKRPVHLTLFVTRRCNARCPFCFYAWARDAEDGAPELSLGEIRQVARSMGPLLWVLFSGGEPFLREDLPELGGIFHEVSRAAFLTIPTNGLLPDVVADSTEELLKRCRDGVVVVKLSLDGVGEEHDRLRRVPGAFEKVMRTHERLAALARRHRRLELGVNTLFCAANQRRIDGIVDLVRRLDGIRSHTLTLVRGDAGGAGEVDAAEYERACRHLEERWRSGPDRFHRFAGAGLKAAQDRVQRRLIRRTLEEGRRPIPCHAGRLGLVLTERGELHPCEGRWDASLGNVRQAGYDVRALLRSPRARGVLGGIGDGRCSCTHECNFLTDILFNPSTWPGVVREWARLRLGSAGPSTVPGGCCSTTEVVS